MTDDNVLVVENLTVINNEKTVLDGVSLAIRRGEIHALVGDHNSGKTVLAEVISGSHRRFKGRVLFNGQIITRPSPAKSSRLGIETIHELPRILPTLNVLENIFPSKRVPKTGRFLDKSGLADTARQKINLFSVDIDLKSRMDSCTSEEQNVVYILRSLCAQPGLLIVNDISKRLTPSQVDVLHSELSVLREKGTTILYVTGNTAEVHNLADRVSFLRMGKIMTTQDVSKLDRLDLVRLSFSNLYQRAELARTSFELFYLNNFYESIINTIPIPFLVINAEKRIVYINNSFAAGYNISKQEYLNSNVCSIFSSNCGELVNFKADSTPLGGKTNKLKNMKIVVNNRTNFADVYLLPVYDEGDAFIGSVLFFDKSGIDINMDRYYQTLETNKKIPFFAHEIKNPLGIIRNFIRLMKQANLGGEISEYLTRSENEIRRISSIVNNLSKEHRTKPGARQKLEARALIDEIKSVFAPMCARDGVSIRNSFDHGVYPTSDEGQLKEVLINLVTNAIEAVSKGGTITVSGGYRKRNGRKQIAIRVMDDGIGIEESHLKLLFEPFYTTKKGKEKRGLGLAICHDILTQFGGTITVESKRNQGSTFTIHLPC